VVWHETDGGLWLTFWLQAKGTHWVDFKVYQATELGFLDMPAAWQQNDFRPTDKLEEAQPIAEGYFKWDGCAEIHLDAHTCSQAHYVALLVRLSKLWGESAEQLAVPWEGFD
jgi:hypothetical protein